MARFSPAINFSICSSPNPSTVPRYARIRVRGALPFCGSRYDSAIWRCRYSFFPCFCRVTRMNMTYNIAHHALHVNTYIRLYMYYKVQRKLREKSIEIKIAGWKIRPQVSKLGGSGFGKQYLRLLVKEVRVMGKEIRMRGSYEALGHAIAQKNLGTPKGVPRFVPAWRALRDSNRLSLGDLAIAPPGIGSGVPQGANFVREWGWPLRRLARWRPPQGRAFPPVRRRGLPGGGSPPPPHHNNQPPPL